MTLSTQQKQQYLDDMGITAWYPRMRLPQAPEAVVFAEPSIEETQAPIAHAETPAVPTPAAPPLAESNVVAMPHVADVPVKDSKPVAQVAPVTQASPVKPVRFGLALYVMGDWLISSSLVSDYQQANDADVRLIQAILRSIDGTTAPVAYHHVISWPFFTNPQASQGIDAAKQYVNGVIEHLTEEHKVTKLLSFGGVLAKLNGWDQAEGQEYSLPRLNLPSVYKMLAQPTLKATAWQHIQQSTLFKHG